MTEKTKGTDTSAFSKWYKTLLDAIIKEMVRVKAIPDINVEAKLAWALPHQMLIAQVRVPGSANEFIWVISGLGVATDHIPGNLAASPRDAARHFTMKWHMDADRLKTLVERKAVVVNPEVDREAYANTLIGYAEDLYDLVSNDELWKQVSLDR